MEKHMDWQADKQIERNVEKQNRYKKTKHVLGEGSYKTVTKAVDEEEGKEVAYNELKIKNYESETKTVSSFSKEIALLRTIDHKNIIKILDYWFSDENFIFITEFMTGGSLNEYIEKNGPLSIKLIRKWGKQVLEGLVYLHTQDPPIIHRDIKNENIFVNTAVGEVKIGDLGLARERRGKRYTIVGTPHFMAREMFEGEGYTEKVDIYAFGMCLIEMATGNRPYTEFTDTKDIYKSVLQGVFPKGLQAITDPCLKSLIISCLVPTGFRYTASQCLDHHFFHTDVLCNGECVPQECVAVYPLLFTPIKNMELSIVAIFDSTVTFQILLFETMKFIKFEYDLTADTVEKVSGELLSELIIDQEAIEDFSNLLTMGLATVESKVKIGKAHDGIIELNSQEIANMKCRDIVISGHNRECAIESEESSSEPTFGKDTLEEIALVEERMKIHEAKMELEKQKEDEISFRLKSKLLQKNASYEPLIVKTEACIIVAKQQSSTALRSSDESYACELEISKSVKFKNVAKEAPEIPEENVYMLFPNVPDYEPISHSDFSSNLDLQNNFDCSISSTSSMPQQLEETLNKIEALNLVTNKNAIPEVMSPVDAPISGENETYEKTKNCPVAQFIYECAAATGRTEETARSWIKALKEDHFESVFDLKLMVYEDWEKLPLTVFSSRAMQNMIYGIDGTPSKEKQLPLNPKIKDYDNKMSIRDFLVDICELINRKELVSSWEDRLLAEDIQTVGELKSLHPEDWNRLGLSVYGYRILKNTILKKGKILIDE